MGKGWESGRLVVTVRVRGWGIHYGYECPQKDRGMCVCERERVREMSWARLVFKQASAVFLHQFMWKYKTSISTYFSLDVLNFNVAPLHPFFFFPLCDTTLSWRPHRASEITLFLAKNLKSLDETNFAFSWKKIMRVAGCCMCRWFSGRINLCQRRNNADIPYWDTSWAGGEFPKSNKALCFAEVWEPAPQWGCSGNEITTSPSPSPPRLPLPLSVSFSPALERFY